MSGMIRAFGIRFIDAVFNSSQTHLDRLSLVLWGSWGKAIV